MSVFSEASDSEVNCSTKRQQTEGMNKLEIASIARLLQTAKEEYDREKNDIKRRASRETVIALEATFDHLHKSLRSSVGID